MCRSFGRFGEIKSALYNHAYDISIHAEYDYIILTYYTYNISIDSRVRAMPHGFLLVNWWLDSGEGRGQGYGTGGGVFNGSHQDEGHAVGKTLGGIVAVWVKKFLVFRYVQILLVVSLQGFRLIM